MRIERPKLLPLDDRCDLDLIEMQLEETSLLLSSFSFLRCNYSIHPIMLPKKSVNQISHLPPIIFILLRIASNLLFLAGF